MDEYIPAIVLFLELLIVVVGGYYIMHYTTLVVANFRNVWGARPAL